MNSQKSPNSRHSQHGYKSSAPLPAEPLIAGQSIELLKELHILTREGKLNQDSRRKLKQVRHLYQFIEPLLVRLQEAQGDFTLVDLGAGKSYLGFILYDLFLHPQRCGGFSASRRAPNLSPVRGNWPTVWGFPACILSI